MTQEPEIGRAGRYGEREANPERMLSEAELAEIRGVFERYAQDGPGRPSQEEVAGAAARLVEEVEWLRERLGELGRELAQVRQLLGELYTTLEQEAGEA
ncbi:MAG TPA: hypothetical protein VIL13_05500 [Longimicrobiales bacterium]